jgi:two-component system phosphate regulon sensor histidine kinase PhoR
MFLEPIFIISFVYTVVVIAVLTSRYSLKRRARALEVAGREMVSNIAHELKTPMTSIVGFVETLQNGAINDPAKAKRFLDIISEEAGRLQTIIDSTLEISRLENLESDTNISEFIFDELIGECVSLLSRSAQDEDIQINTYYKKSERLHVRANKTRIKQVIFNLVGNAIKYNQPHGRVDITVDNKGKNLILSVFNTGKGLRHEHIQRLFERFYRVDDGRTRDVGGTGLGLAIVKRIVNLYDGRVEVESQAGEHVEFIVTLPICI